MTPFDQAVARLKGDIDFMMADAKVQAEDGAAMLRIFGLDDGPMDVAELLGACGCEASSANGLMRLHRSAYRWEPVDPFADVDAANEPPLPSSTPWLARFKEATNYANADLGEVLGVKGVTVQAYTAGRIPENFSRRQKEALRAMCVQMRQSLELLESEL